jgi:hypothetical protein
VADLGFSDAGYGLAQKGEGAGGGTPPARGPGLGPRKIFLKISIENLHFKGHVYAVFMYFLDIVLHYVIPKRH